jgi:hypothetical protein
MKKNFYYKVEDLPVIGRFILNSLKNDINDFNHFSPMFNPNYIKIMETKVNSCSKVVKSSFISKRLKKVTQDLYYKSTILHLKLNTLEGYFKRGSDHLDIPIEDVGLKSVKNDIVRHHTERLLLNMQKIMATVKRNQSILEAKGLKPKLIKEIESQMNEIKDLNIIQNTMISNRNKLIEENIEMFNDLWESLQPILKTAKTIYYGEDETKLKEYTVTQLIKRIDAEKRKNTNGN